MVGRIVFAEKERAPVVRAQARHGSEPLAIVGVQPSKNGRPPEDFVEAFGHRHLFSSI
jgi:hypothetical protein